MILKLCHWLLDLRPGQYLYQDQEIASGHKRPIETPEPGPAWLRHLDSLWRRGGGGNNPSGTSSITWHRQQAPFRASFSFTEYYLLSYRDCDSVSLVCDVTQCLCFVLTGRPGRLGWCCWARRASGAGASLGCSDHSVGVWSPHSAAVSHYTCRHPPHSSLQSVIKSGQTSDFI